MTAHPTQTPTDATEHTQSSAKTDPIKHSSRTSREMRLVLALEAAPKEKHKQYAMRWSDIAPGHVIYHTGGYARVISKRPLTPGVLPTFQICARPLEGHATPQHLIIFQRRSAEYATQVVWYREQRTLFSAPPVLHLVGCARTKRQHPCPAKDLYVSPRFKSIRCLVDSAPWAILSARHGLVWPDQVIEPYDETLAHCNQKQRREWCYRVLRIVPPALRYVIWAGTLYAKDLAPILNAELPLARLGIGEQLAFLKQQARRHMQPGE